MYKLMANKLVEFYQDFNIEQKKSTAEYLKKVDEYNNNIDTYKAKTKGILSYDKKNYQTKIDRSKIGLILTSLERYDLNQLQNIIGFSRSTLSYYKTQLSKIGYSKNTQDLCKIDVPDFNFKPYFTETILNQYKIFQNNFFILKH